MQEKSLKMYFFKVTKNNMYHPTYLPDNLRQMFGPFWVFCRWGGRPACAPPLPGVSRTGGSPVGTAGPHVGQLPSAGTDRPALRSPWARNIFRCLCWVPLPGRSPRYTRPVQPLQMPQWKSLRCLIFVSLTLLTLRLNQMKRDKDPDQANKNIITEKQKQWIRSIKSWIRTHGKSTGSSALHWLDVT